MDTNAKTYVFGNFRFVPSESLLLKDGEAIALPPKALNILEKLVENAGNVTKDDLIRDVWDDVAVEESAVPRTVFLVRSALDDDPKNHAFIQTVPKRGYRFVATVSTLNGSNGSGIQARSLPDPLPVSGGTSRRLSPAHLIAAIVLLCTVSVGAYFGFFKDAQPNKISLLIMPVTSAAAQEGDDLLENSLADALIHQLASSRNILVRPMSATRTYSGKTTDPIQAGREQKVQKVLSATYQKADGTFRILSRLIDVETSETEGSYKFEIAESRVFAIQDAVAADLGSKIALKFGAPISPVPSRGTTDEEAYRHYLQGMALHDRRNDAKAVESFERATELDPDFARAWEAKAVALGSMPSLGGSSPLKLYERTVQAADRALALNPASAEAYGALCGAKLSYAHDFAGAEQTCTKAMELDPRSPVVLQNHSFLRISQGRIDEGLQSINKALDIEPTSFFSQSQYSQALYLARRFDEAYAQYVRLIELEPDRLPTYEHLIRTLEASGREPEAMEWLLRSLRVRKADETVIERISQAYREAGWQGVLRERIATDTDKMNYFRQAGLNARLGNKEAAFELLRKGLEQRPPVFVTLRAEPQFDPIRDDPRFAELVRRLESGK